MDGPPETKYVAVGDSDVAYQVLGEGPLDLLYFYGFGSQIDLLWDHPATAAYFQHLASFCRLILFDRRGTGLSDSLSGGTVSTWEEWVEDLGAVLDTAGSRRAAIFAAVDSGPIASLFAATHPERVNALILHNSSARYLVAEDYPIGQPTESVDEVVELVRSTWGTVGLQLIANPGGGEEVNRINAKIGRAAATPRTAAAQFDYVLRHVDVREALPLIQAPTLVFHNRNPMVPMEHGRYIAEHIPDASFVELLDASVAVDVGDPTFTDRFSEFLTGELRIPAAGRILATVLFTDIVKSTEHLVRLGDQRWVEMLERHNECVRDQVRLFGGREVNTTGDGFVTSFDVPSNAIRCGQEIIKSTQNLGLDLRVGLHTGECVIHGEDLAGVALNIAARVCASAGAGEVLVSATVRDSVAGSGIEFVERGEYELKGVSPEPWKLFTVR
jgi:class 3 adenylate cyclase